VRTALFGTLGDLAGASVLDLFAGTGALGFEALSRGAAEAWFFERDAACVEAIRRSADKLRAGGRVQVVEGALPASLREAAGRGADVAFVDPPYATVDKPDAREPFLRLLSALASTGSLRPGALVVVEHREGSVPGAPAELEADETRVYGQTALSYYRVRK
jgi:16S rRNA (guanine966-N2)-methyltransferase